MFQNVGMLAAKQLLIYPLLLFLCLLDTCRDD